MGRKYALLGDNQAVVSAPTAHAVVTEDALLGKVVRIFRIPIPGRRKAE